MSSTAASFDDTILANLDGAMTPPMAEGILSLGFSSEQQMRMRQLAAKARSGDLSAEEQEEAHSYERISSLLGILQSRARMALKQASE